MGIQSECVGKKLLEQIKNDGIDNNDRELSSYVDQASI